MILLVTMVSEREAKVIPGEPELPGNAIFVNRTPCSCGTKKVPCLPSKRSGPLCTTGA